MAQSASIAELAKALCEAQFEMTSAKKDSVNPHFRSKYADLTSVWDACRASLHKHGLAVVQAPEPCDQGIQLRTVLMHTSGEWIDSVLMVPAIKLDPQAFGSAMSYARRYALSAMVGVVADEDDDGNAASQPVQQPQQRAASNGHATANGADRTTGGASTKQIGMIRGLMKKNGWAEADTLEWAGIGVAKLDDLSSRQASDLIEALQKAAAETAEQAAV